VRNDLLSIFLNSIEDISQNEKMLTKITVLRKPTYT